MGHPSLGFLRDDQGFPMDFSSQPCYFANSNGHRSIAATQLGPGCISHGSKQRDGFLLCRLIARHARYTGSAQAKRILERWSEYRTKFVKVFPNEYRRALGELATKHKLKAA